MLDKLIGADFDSPVEATFDETVARTVEDTHTHLLAALEHNAVRAGYWRTYWQNICPSIRLSPKNLPRSGLWLGVRRTCRLA